MTFLKQNWDVICDTDTNKTYDTFLNIFVTLYEKTCPVKKQNIGEKQKDRPWITKGINNPCKRKNTICREFVKERTIERKEVQTI